MPKPISLPARAATADEAYDEEEDYEGEDEPNMKFIHALFVVLILHVIAVGGIFAFNSMKAKQTAKTASKTSAVAEAAKTDAATAAPSATPAAKPANNASLAGWKGKTHEVVAGDTLAKIAASYKVSADAIGKENNITTYSMLRVGQVLKIPAASDKASTKPTTTETAKHVTDNANKQAFLATKTEVSAKPANVAAAPKATPAAETATATETKPAAATSTAEAGTYVVAKGENPYSIAKKLHVSYNELLAANGIKDPTKIQIGQKLKIPEKKN